MKKTQLVTTVLLVAAIAIGWLATITGIGDTAAADYKESLQEAQDFYSRGLYQKAAEAYEEVVSVKSTEENWKALLDSYSARYKESEDIYDDYLDAAQRAVDKFGKNVDFVMQLVELHKEKENYAAATEVLQNAVDAGVNTPEIKAALLENRYAFALGWGTFDQVLPFTNGFYRVTRAEEQYYVGDTGDTMQYNDVVLLGPVGEDSYHMVVSSERGTLMDSEKVVQGIFPKEIEAVGMYAEELIPVKVKGTYSYYNALGDKQFGNYTEASAFCEGVAAVNENGKWKIIDTQGKEKFDISCDAVILAPDGTCVKDDAILAKAGQTYTFYDLKGKKLAEFSADAVDVPSEDGLVAFCKSGKWGFVNKEGKVVIEPAFTQAKSFAGGLAAVNNGQKWGFVNVDGAVVIDYQFDGADYFTENGFCMVKEEAFWQQLELKVKD